MGRRHPFAGKSYRANGITRRFVVIDEQSEATAPAVMVGASALGA